MPAELGYEVFLVICIGVFV